MKLRLEGPSYIFHAFKRKMMQELQVLTCLVVIGIGFVQDVSNRRLWNTSYEMLWKAIPVVIYNDHDRKVDRDANFVIVKINNLSEELIWVKGIIDLSAVK